MLCLLLIVLQFGLILNINLPRGVKICHQSDPDFNNCVTNQMSTALDVYKDGLPTMGIPKLEPFTISKLEILGNNKGSRSINHKYKNMLTYGIHKSDVYDGKFSLSRSECYWDFWVLTPHVHLEADYELTGKLLLFTLNSQGRCNISITNLRNHHRAPCERYMRLGKTYLKLSNYNIDINLDQVHFDFDNLFPGNQEISKEVLKVLNENALAIFQDVKRGFEVVWNSLHMQTANNFLSKLPLDDAFPQ